MNGATRKKITPQRALARLEDLCARSEQCTGELTEKLYRWGIGAADRKAIIDSLVNRHFVDDRRFASAYVRDRLMFARWGRRKIAASLIQKRIPRDITDEALDEIDDDTYHDTIKSVMKSRLRSSGPVTTRDDYMKLLRYGIQRGFETDLTAKTIRELMTERENDQEDTD